MRVIGLPPLPAAKSGRDERNALMTSALFVRIRTGEKTSSAARAVQPFSGHARLLAEYVSAALGSKCLPEGQRRPA